MSHLKRFPSEKKEQIEQLIVYAKLMGLTGRDLVAIGGQIDREEARLAREANMKIVSTFDCLPIGYDSELHLDERFKLKTSHGAYNFYCDGWNGWAVTSLKTKSKKTFKIDVTEYHLPKTDFRRKCRYALLLDIAQGKITLDF